MAGGAQTPKPPTGSYVVEELGADTHVCFRVDVHRLAHVEMLSNDSGFGDLVTEAWDPGGADLDLRWTSSSD